MTRSYWYDVRSIVCIFALKPEIIVINKGDKDSLFSCLHGIRCGERLVSLERPVIMGILNITPDSFFDGGTHLLPEDWIAHTGRMLAEGATFIDIGVVSTRPGAHDMSERAEIEALAPVLEALTSQFPEVLFSVDTWRARVAEMAISKGAVMINDISGGRFDPGMIPFIGEAGVPFVVMHTLDRPAVMQVDPIYEDVVAEVMEYLARQVDALLKAGATDLLVDPGFGFGKTMVHNYTLLRELGSFRALGFPILAGLSRKSMLYKLLDCQPQDALNATTAAHMLALIGGASVLRAHDVRQAAEAIRIFEAWKYGP